MFVVVSFFPFPFKPQIQIPGLKPKLKGTRARGGDGG